jgi:tetratricopeptide (TPR) repeat protein
MRCPKCGESFRVERPGTGQPEPAAAPPAPPPTAAATPPVLGAALGFASPGFAAQPNPRQDVAPPTSRERDSIGRSTMLGVAPQAGGAPHAGVGAPSRGPLLELEDISVSSAPPGPPSSGSLDLPLAANPQSPKDWGLPELVGPKGSPPRLQRAAPRAQAPAAGAPPVPHRAGPNAAPTSPADPTKTAPRPAPRAAPPSDPLGFDLPQLAPSSAPGLPDLAVGLPDLGSALPDLSASLPDLSAGLPDLGASLPGVGGSLPDLAAGLPHVGGGLPDLAAELPLQGGAGLTEGPRSIQLPSFPPGGAPSSAPRGADSSEFGEEFGHEPGFDRGGLARDQGGMAGDDLFGTGPTHRAVTDPSALGAAPAHRGDDEEFDAFPTQTQEKARQTTGSSGGVGYGEVSLDGGAGDLALGDELESREGPRGAGSPMGAPAAVTAQVTRPGPTPVQGKKVKQKGPGVSRSVRVGALAALLTVALGAGLSAFPSVGPFGAYLVIDLVRSGKYAEELSQDVEAVRRKMDADTTVDFDAAFRNLVRARESAPRFRPRTAFTAYEGIVRQLKFGSDTSTGAQAKALLDTLVEQKVEDVEYLELARMAARALDKRGKDAWIEASKIHASPEHTFLAAEILNREGDAQVALPLWQKLQKANSSARSEFGLARALALLGLPDAAPHVEAALAKNPKHIGARLLQIELLLKKRGDDPGLETTLTEISQSPEAGQFEKSRALTLQGELLLKRSRLKQAEEAFNAALRLDVGSPYAQRGLANVLYEAGRYADALARFEAAAGLQPEDLQIQLGIVRTKIRLEQHDDASKRLARLTAAFPQSTAVQYWLGRSKEALGEKGPAEEAYQKAVQAGEDVPELVEATVALTRLLGQSGRHAQASEAIEAALVRFPNEPRVFRALGELSESRGNYDDAILNFDKALALDPSNVGVRFARAVALRKARRFEEAARELDAVEQGEKGYPGLSLERGNLYAAAGRTAEALKAYESALAAAPNDPDLMLRVGCGKAQAGHADEASELLGKVLAQRPMSAEVNFCLGLAQFKAGKDLPTARRTLDRALGLDGTRPEYYLYAGWVALELRDYASALRAFDHALELDQSLADAYWLRGMLRVRQGAIADAERDLRRALTLNPSRFEAHATLAEAYMQMGKEGDALNEFALAAQGGPLEPYIEYRYGKVLMDNRRVPDAKPHLERALAEEKGGDNALPWVWDAHRLLAMAIGLDRQALVHWEAFIEHGPSDSPYRVEAVRAMKAIVTSLGH